MFKFPTILKPTRLTTQSATLIDNIFTNDIGSKVASGILLNDIRDHLPVFTVVQSVTWTKIKTGTTKWIRKRFCETLGALKKDLSKQKCNQVYLHQNPNKAYDEFITIFMSLYDKHCPLQQQRIYKYEEKPWITKGLDNACKKKNVLYKQFLKCRTEEAENKYKKYKNRLTTIMRNNKKNYYNKLLEIHKSNTQGTWKVINNIINKSKNKSVCPNYFLTNNKQNVSTPMDIANGFNDFFINVGHNLAKQIDDPIIKDDVSEKMIDINRNTIFLTEVEERELIDIVNKFKNKKSTDYNDIDMNLIKNIILFIAKPLTYICNQSLQTGIFPNKMKMAKVIPIFKNGNKHNFCNYQPISLLPQFSKILETLFAHRLEDFIEKQHLLSDQQYGFRANRSTTMAVMELIDNISTNTKNKEYTVGLFIDLKKLLILLIIHYY